MSHFQSCKLQQVNIIDTEYTCRYHIAASHWVNVAAILQQGGSCTSESQPAPTAVIAH